MIVLSICLEPLRSENHTVSLPLLRTTYFRILVGDLNDGLYQQLRSEILKKKSWYQIFCIIHSSVTI